MRTKIEKLDHFGRGITYINGKICFVDGALPLEDLKIKIVSETKKYSLADVDDYYTLSDDRCDVLCPYDNVCGGCNLLHLNFSGENKFKCMKVKEILKKFGNINEELVTDTISDSEYNYRNKITLHCDDNMLGYYRKGTKRIVPIEKCLLVEEEINKVIKVLNELIYDNDIDEVVIRVSNDSSEIMVSITGDISNYEELQNVVDVLEINNEIVLGDESIISNIGNKKYYVSSKSFFQVNKTLTEKLYNEVLDVIKKVQPKKVLDLYCGTGTIGIYISDCVDEVVGVDYSKSGILVAKKNSLLNNVNNCSFICDKVENVIDSFNDIDMIIVDPPRAGLDDKTIENIKRINPQDIVYISCDPVTLGRDLKLFSDMYEVVIVKPYNMFPKTYHVENFVLLKRKK